MSIVHESAQTQNSLILAILIAITVAIFWRTLIKIAAIGAITLAVLGLVALMSGIR
jgi:hypothetical protein